MVTISSKKTEEYGNKYIDILLALIVNLIIFSANNKLMAFTKHLSLLGVLVVLFDTYILRRDFSTKINVFKTLILTFMAFLAFSCLFVQSSSYIIDYSLYFIFGLCLIIMNHRKSFYYYFMKIFKVIFWLFIASIFLESISPELFHKIFSFASFGDEAMREKVSGGAVAGLAFEKAYAAFICNLGIGVILAEYVVKKSSKNIVQLLLVMIALMMTGKRTLFIVPIAIILIYVLLYSKNNKFLKLAGAGLAIVLLVLVIYIVVPSAALIINRLLDNGGDLLSGRENFWKYAMEMFRQNPILGAGFMSFNDYVYSRGFRYYGGRWNYQAHNVYIQLLGETGVVGFGIIVSLIVLLIIHTIKSSKNNKNFWNLLTVYWTILFAIYGLTGNTIYYPCQLIILFICIMFVSEEKKIQNIQYITGKRIKLIV